MATTNRLRDTLDDLMLSAERIEELTKIFDVYALRDVLDRLHSEIRAVRRELLLRDADSLIRLARPFGDLR